MIEYITAFAYAHYMQASPMRLVSSITGFLLILIQSSLDNVGTPNSLGKIALGA